jgi:protein-L-isoaspartate(D-aspartate) O-methyltransferase
VSLPSTITLTEARRWFAEGLRVTAHVHDERVLDAFAAVPRERFAGPGPWRFFNLFEGYWSTPDDDIRWLYHNVLVALDERRGLNIGEPFLWAHHFDRVGVHAGERVLQIGAGSGYYTAILAELAGPAGRVDAVEIDGPLAANAERNLELWPTARVQEGNGTLPIDGQWDVIVAFAGATTPMGWWLDALADGGRLLLPMTAAGRRGGFMLRIDRHGGHLAARSAGWVAFYPCAGGRSPEDEAALGEALNDPEGQRALRWFRRDRHDRDASCWLHADGWCLSKQERH